MEQLIRDNMDRLDIIAHKDPYYLHLLKTIKEYEAKLDLLEQDLTEDQRDLIWDFWGISTEVDQRMLFLACKYMRFP